MLPAQDPGEGVGAVFPAAVAEPAGQSAKRVYQKDGLVELSPLGPVPSLAAEPFSPGSRKRESRRVRVAVEAPRNLSAASRAHSHQTHATGRGSRGHRWQSRLRAADASRGARARARETTPKTVRISRRGGAAAEPSVRRIRGPLHRARNVASVTVEPADESQRAPDAPHTHPRPQRRRPARTRTLRTLL